MNESLSQALLAHLAGGDPVVRGVLYALIAMSVITWALIFYKALEIGRARLAGARFAQAFWNSDDAVAYLAAASKGRSTNPLASLASSGVKALQHYTEHNSEGSRVSDHLPETLTRALRQAIQDQLTHFEAGLGMLATIGNTAPFVGLFGTVIGIMSALKGIAASGSADLQVVSGPIGEALVATAAGIACALPAVIAYNSFLRRLKVLGNTLDSFAYDVLAQLACDRALRHCTVAAPAPAEGPR
jgi:biopolymer transport protein ExbB